MAEKANNSALLHKNSLRMRDMTRSFIEVRPLVIC
jgi:hypothetical protein